MQSAPAAPSGRAVAEPATGRVARTTRAAAAYRCEPLDKDRQHEQPHACRSSRRGKEQAASAQELSTTAHPDRSIGKRNFRRHQTDSGVDGDEVGKAAKKEPGEHEQATSKSLTTRPFNADMLTWFTQARITRNRAGAAPALRSDSGHARKRLVQRNRVVPYTRTRQAL